MSHRRPRFRGLAVATVVVGLFPAVFPFSIGEPVQLGGAYFGWGVAMYLFGAGGTLTAATTFLRGEPMRPGWFLLSASYLALLPAMLWNGPRGAPLYDAPIRSPGLLLASNVAWAACSISALFLLSRAWRSSGLDLTARPARLLARLVALGVALALAGPDLVERIPAAMGGDLVAAGDVLTDVLDGALFVVAVPILRAALALGGGLVAWPWLLLTLSVAAWLGYDAVGIYGDALGLGPLALRGAEESFRTLAASFAFSAGVAQRWVMVERGAPARPDPGPG